MDYATAIGWYMALPVTVWLAYRFVMLNLKHHAKMERLEQLEARYADETTKEQI